MAAFGESTCHHGTIRTRQLREGSKISSGAPTAERSRGIKYKNQVILSSLPNSQPSSSSQRGMTSSSRFHILSTREFFAPLWETSVTPLQCMQDPLAKQGEPS